MSNAPKYILYTLGMCVFIAVFALPSCKQRYIPKPKGYFRIDLPQHQYQHLQGSYPYTFQFSTQAEISERVAPDEKFWIDIIYPSINAKIHCSYKPVEDNLRELSDDAQGFVYKHSNMANSIPEQGFENEVDKVYGVLYELKGNTASPAQFYLTDSTQHFFRAALYFDCIPNSDSLLPVFEYVEQDIRHLIETFKWK
ncbi:MAG: gliding motility lipoprotein GldD [Paludibacteraceae bacterium]|nr:gliding motility lipoprotein GldD [Paludibacteraceae bacterium]